MAKDHGRAASIANSSESSKKGGEKSGKGSGGSKSQKRATGREGGRKSSQRAAFLSRIVERRKSQAESHPPPITKFGPFRKSAWQPL
jgi:hypothetical protein